MTEKQYLKYLIQVNFGTIKSVYCPKCKHKNYCDKKLQEECVIRFEKRNHLEEWSFEIGLAREQERDRKRKENEKRLKEKLKEIKENVGQGK